MFAFITLGTNDLSLSSKFYDKLLESLGIFKIINEELDDTSYTIEDMKNIINENIQSESNEIFSMINTYLDETITRTRTVSTLIKVLKTVLKYIKTS